jgi:hypothetical protein
VVVKESNKEFKNRPIYRYSEVADWTEQFVLGIPEVEQSLRKKSLKDLDKNQIARLRSFLQGYMPF